MTEREGFLNAIRHFPNEDAPRLIYADWLDEHGEAERAAFIRFGVEVREPLPPNISGPVSARFGLPHGPSVGPLMGGFVSSVVLPGPPDLVEDLAELVRSEPLMHCDVQGVEWGEFAPQIRRVIGLLQGCFGLSADGTDLARAEAAELLAPLLRCRRLVVNDGEGRPAVEFPNAADVWLHAAVDADTILAACGGPITGLTLRETFLPVGSLPPGLRRLALGRASANHLRNLGDRPITSLDLGWLTPREAKASIQLIAGWPGGVGLERLRFGGGQLDASRLQLLANATPKLRTLDLLVNLAGRNPTGLLRLWPDIRTLTVHGWVAGLALAEQFLPQLSSLRLEGRAQEWGQTSRMLKVRANGLRELRLGQVPLSALAEVSAGRFESLEVLTLDASGDPTGWADADPIRALADSPFGARGRALVLGPPQPGPARDAAIRLFGPRCDAYWY